MVNNNFNGRMFEEALKIVLAEHEQKELEEYNDIILKEGKHRFSPEFEATMEKLLKHSKKSKADSYKSFSKSFKRIAVVLLIVLSVSFVGLLTVKAVRQEIYNAFMTFFEKYIHIEFKNEDGLQKDDNGIITETYLPSYISEGYTEYEISKSDGGLYAYYVNDENDVISYTQGLVSASVDVDGENYIISDVNINGINGKLYKYNKSGTYMPNIVVWNDDKYFYKVNTHLSEDEAVKIAKSVIPVSDK